MRMAVFACLYHWYTSAMYVVPVLAVGGWGWWSTKRISKRQGPGGPSAGAGGGDPGDPGGIGERAAF
jgi:hypothetical protein